MQVQEESRNVSQSIISVEVLVVMEEFSVHVPCMAALKMLSAKMLTVFL
jgi:hypothetical protein